MKHPRSETVEKTRRADGGVVGGIKRQSGQSGSLGNMRHRRGLKANNSAGDRVHYCNDERQTSAGLPARESVHFLPPDFIKRRFAGLKPGRPLLRRERGERAVGVQGRRGARVAASVHSNLQVGSNARANATHLWRFLPVPCVCSRAPRSSCSGLPLPSPCWSKMKDICSSDEGSGARDAPYRLRHVALGLALISVKRFLFFFFFEF